MAERDRIKKTMKNHELEALLYDKLSKEEVEKQVKELMESKEKKIMMRRAALNWIWNNIKFETLQSDKTIEGFYMGIVVRFDQERMYILEESGPVNIKINKDFDVDRSINLLAPISVTHMTLKRNQETGSEWWENSPETEVIKNYNGDVNQLRKFANDIASIGDQEFYAIFATVDTVKRIPARDPDTGERISDDATIPIMGTHEKMDEINLRIGAVDEDTRDRFGFKIVDQDWLLELLADDCEDPGEFLSLLADDDVSEDDILDNLMALEGKEFFIFSQGSNMMGDTQLPVPWMSLKNGGFLMEMGRLEAVFEDFENMPTDGAVAKAKPKAVSAGKPKTPKKETKKVAAKTEVVEEVEEAVEEVEEKVSQGTSKDAVKAVENSGDVVDLNEMEFDELEQLIVDTLQQHGKMERKSFLSNYIKPNQKTDIMKAYWKLVKRDVLISGNNMEFQKGVLGVAE